jgi:hypothetical protein
MILNKRLLGLFLLKLQTLTVIVMNKHKKWLCSLSKTNKSLKQDKKQLVFARASLILTNYFIAS